MAQPSIKKRAGKYKIQAKFLELREVNDVLINIILFDSKNRYCMTAFRDKFPVDTYKPNETLVIRFNIKSTLFKEKYYNQFFIVKIDRKSDLDQEKLQALKSESDYTSATIFQQNTNFDNK